MFASPVQKATDYLTHSPMFKKIYHFYSTNDQVQTMDFTCPNQWFSKRVFKKKKNFKLPSTLTQVQMRITRELQPKKRHFKLPESFDYLILDHPHFKPLYDSPNHTEFWHFQWGSAVYRPKFALAPLPIFVFTPTIIHALQHYTPNTAHIIFNFAPLCSGALITDLLSKKNFPIPLLDEIKISKIRAVINGKEQNEQLDIAEQKKHFNEALKNAEEEYSMKNLTEHKHAFSALNSLWRYAIA